VLSSTKTMECVQCQATDLDRRLEKCPMCFKLICETCAVRLYGRTFCTKTCADTFFFGDDDE
jgi:hypothetical protein